MDPKAPKSNPSRIFLVFPCAATGQPPHLLCLPACVEAITRPRVTTACIGASSRECTCRVTLGRLPASPSAGCRSPAWKPLVRCPRGSIAICRSANRLLACVGSSARPRCCLEPLFRPAANACAPGFWLARGRREQLWPVRACGWVGRVACCPAAWKPAALVVLLPCSAHVATFAC